MVNRIDTVSILIKPVLNRKYILFFLWNVNRLCVLFCFLMGNEVEGEDNGSLDMGIFYNEPFIREELSTKFGELKMVEPCPWGERFL